MNLSELKKILLKRGFKVSKISKNKFNKKIKNFNLLILFSLVIISFFSFLPKGVDFSTKLLDFPDPVENNSKIDFEKTLLGIETKKSSNLDNKINEKNLFDDVIQLNETPMSSVRLSASLSTSTAPPPRVAVRLTDTLSILHQSRFASKSVTVTASISPMEKADVSRSCPWATSSPCVSTPK